MASIEISSVTVIDALTAEFWIVEEPSERQYIRVSPVDRQWFSTEVDFDVQSNTKWRTEISDRTKDECYIFVSPDEVQTIDVGKPVIFEIDSNTDWRARVRHFSRRQIRAERFVPHYISVFPAVRQYINRELSFTIETDARWRVVISDHTRDENYLSVGPDNVKRISVDNPAVYEVSSNTDWWARVKHPSKKQRVITKRIPMFNLRKI